MQDDALFKMLVSALATASSIPNFNATLISNGENALAQLNAALSPQPRDIPWNWQNPMRDYDQDPAVYTQIRIEIGNALDALNNELP